jgi:hypothetical protein
VARNATCVGLSTTIRPTPTLTALLNSLEVMALPCKIIRLGSTPPTSAVASSPPEHTQSPAPSSATHRAMAVVRSASPA